MINSLVKDGGEREGVGSGIELKLGCKRGLVRIECRGEGGRGKGREREGEGEEEEGGRRDRERKEWERKERERKEWEKTEEKEVAVFFSFFS